MQKRINLLTTCLLFICWWFLSGSVINAGEGKSVPADTESRLKDLLITPSCLESSNNRGDAYNIEVVSIPSGGITLYGQLYVPGGSGAFPAVVFMHGGGNDYDMLMSGPRYYASRLARCGIAALIYDKRGTGQSGGKFHESTYDDFIDDAGNAVTMLAHDPRFDSARIGVYGGSEGGRLAPLVAVRFPHVAFVVTVSGPIGSVSEQANFNMNYALRFRGYPDSLVDRVLPLWYRHHASWANLDLAEMDAVKAEVMRLRDSLDPHLIPSTREEILNDSNLYFVRPQFASMSRDYTSELAQLSVPWLALFGEHDPIINVRESVANIDSLMKTAGNNVYELFVIENGGHSLQDTDTGEFLPTENVLLNWINERLTIKQADSSND